MECLVCGSGRPASVLLRTRAFETVICERCYSRFAEFATDYKTLANFDVIERDGRIYISTDKTVTGDLNERFKEMMEDVDDVEFDGNPLAFSVKRVLRGVPVEYQGKSAYLGDIDVSMDYCLSGNGYVLRDFYVKPSPATLESEDLGWHPAIQGDQLCLGGNNLRRNSELGDLSGDLRRNFNTIESVLAGFNTQHGYSKPRACWGVYTFPNRDTFLRIRNLSRDNNISFDKVVLSRFLNIGDEMIELDNPMAALSLSSETELNLEVCKDLICASSRSNNWFFHGDYHIRRGHINLSTWKADWTDDGATIHRLSQEKERCFDVSIRFGEDPVENDNLTIWVKPGEYDEETCGQGTRYTHWRGDSDALHWSAQKKFNCPIKLNYGVQLGWANLEKKMIVTKHGFLKNQEGERILKLLAPILMAMRPDLRAPEKKEEEPSWTEMREELMGGQ